MGVLDGQPVDAATTNPAFLDANQDDTALGIISLANGQPASGAPIGNVQGSLNNLLTGTGATETTPGTQYSSNTVITDGDSHETALGKIDAKFDDTTGHAHDGTPGNGAPITPTSIVGIPLFGTYVQGANLLGVVGTSIDVSALLIGQTPSNNSTTEGVVVNAPHNRVLLLSALAPSYEERLRDGSQNPIYGRLTEAAGVWTLSFFVINGGVETVHNFAASVDLLWFYQKLFKRIENAPVYSDQLAQEWPRFAGTSIVTDETITNVNSSPFNTVTSNKVLLVDASGGPITVNLYATAGQTGIRMRIKKIDATANAVTIVPNGADTIDGLASYQLTAQHEGITMVTSTGVWRVFA